MQEPNRLKYSNFIDTYNLLVNKAKYAWKNNDKYVHGYQENAKVEVTEEGITFEFEEWCWGWTTLTVFVSAKDIDEVDENAWR